MNSSENRNIITAVILSIMVLVGWNYFFPNQTDKALTQKTVTSQQPVAEAHTAPTKALQSLNNSPAPTINSARIKIDTPKIQGSIRTVGCYFDDITLKEYTTEPANKGQYVRLMGSGEKLYYSEFGWLSDDHSVNLPNGDTPWQVDKTQILSINRPVTMNWDNGQGLTFVRKISIDDQYMFSITDTVHNSSHTKISLSAFGLIARNLPATLANFFILHEGPIGYLDKKLIEHKYSDFDKTKQYHYDAVGGWLGITDKYWLTALVPNQSTAVNVNYRESLQDNAPRYQTDYATGYYTLNPDANITYTHHLYAGAKKIEILDNYEKTLKIPHFDLAVDFGWFYFLTKPIFYFLTALGEYVGNFGIAILIFTLLLKLIMFPLANKSYRSMARMRELQPKIEQLKTRCGDDRLKLNQEMMELYKKEKINPASGCLPMLVQIPVFFALYKVLFVTIEMRHAPFFGWIHDLSAPDPTTIFNLFGLLPFTPPSFLMIGAWPLIMGATMFIQQKLTPAPADPTQAKVMMLLPIIFTFTLAQFPAGLVIYWAWNNILTILQQTTIMNFEKKRSLKRR